MTTDTAMSALFACGSVNGYIKEHGEKAARQVIGERFQKWSEKPSGASRAKHKTAFFTVYSHPSPARAT